ncbi:hypothetical protein MKZ38_008508 [Zalerion maritima]|uniref:Enoyl reductase (ER) domain-containing protein n=1 Tax=Zalerion maritima TaxID=339359 RepID=A0AAD5WMN6_9PEZI|nr:hypothetical protein MKZ38_008508 [Zalerion maritima]
MAPAALTCAMTAESAPAPKPLPSRIESIGASVLHGPQRLKFEMRTITQPGVGELQVAIRKTGICGSDVSYYKKFANGDLCACEPLSLGHESSGEVVAIGPAVTGFRVGDRVALEVGVACGTCELCRRGRYNLCKTLRFRSSAKTKPHYQGTLQEKINHPAIWCHKLPDHISYDAAALLEPLSVAIHAVNRASPTPGSTALVIGAGTVGLLTAAMARQSGCAEVMITDVDEGRVRYATERGFATQGYVVPRSSPQSSGCPSTSSSGTSTPADSGTATPALSIFSVPPTVHDPKAQFAPAEELAKSIMTDMRMKSTFMTEDDDGVDITFECTGKAICMQTSLYATNPGGKVIMVGMGTPIQTLPLSVAHLREIDILGIFRYANTYATGIRLISGQKYGGICQFPSLDNMITHRFKGLQNAHQAFELAGRTVDDEGQLVLKVVIEA